jgi:hypothetical protein
MIRRVICFFAGLCAGAGTLGAQTGDASPRHSPTRYDITVVPSDTGGHLLLEVETGWRLGSAQPVVLALDSAFRVVRVLVEGKPNTRLSRTMYARGPGEVVVPHEKASGDTLTTRVRYHGTPRGGLRVAPNRYGERALVAQASTADPSLWLPVPESSLRTASVSLRVQADSGQRIIGSGTPGRIDTLAYGHTTWQFTLERPTPLTAIAAAAGPYAVTWLSRSGCAGTCTPVSVWTWRRDSSFALTGPFRRAAEIADYFTRLLGPPPYSSLAHVETIVPDTAITAASVILYGESNFVDGGISEDIVARATARQWLRLDAPDSAAGYLAGLWRAKATGKDTRAPDLARVRGYLRSP